MLERQGIQQGQQTLSALSIVNLGGVDIPIAAATNFRRLRALGVTVRKTIDTVIATRCIMDGHELLHSDRDFDAFQQHFGLRCVACEAGLRFTTATGAVATATRLTRLFETDRARIRAAGRPAAALEVHDALQQRPTTNLNEAAARVGMTYPTAAKGMKTLVDLGIARELTGRKRNRIFVYSVSVLPQTDPA